MAKRRKRKSNLGSAPAKHRSDATRLYQYAKDAQLDAKEAKTCTSALKNLVAAHGYAAQAELSISSVGEHEGGVKSRSGRIRGSVSALRRQLTKEFDGTLKNCIK